ncbi:MAG: hypothetical protein J0I52_14275, partial [Bordetella sp.]|nr:hypothetical protein [Bordetella sp.]
LEPAAWSQALYVPPWRPMLPLADGLEQIGPKLFPGAAGLIMLEASRRAYARVRPGGLTQAVLAGRPALTPSPAARDHAHPRHALPHLALPRHALPMGAARKQP